jgi:hypothetical protein
LFRKCNKFISELKDLPASRTTFRKVVWRQFVMELKDF